MVANKLAKFNGTNWCSVEYGVDLRPRSLVVYNNDLIINGDFYTASGVAANNNVKYTPARNLTGIQNNNTPQSFKLEQNYPCLLYTSDAADERSSVDLGGRRIIKKKNKKKTIVH